MNGASRWLEASVTSGAVAAVHAGRLQKIVRLMVVIPLAVLLRVLRGPRLYGGGPAADARPHDDLGDTAPAGVPGVPCIHRPRTAVAGGMGGPAGQVAGADSR